MSRPPRGGNWLKDGLAPALKIRVDSSPAIHVLPGLPRIETRRRLSGPSLW
ncbi:hypothetical protein V5E97_07545 [Singulisphaera sp. Ch08]|uniref:Uncharacterized protein n=1 Tax=Singulisphaera sp. Ch08 TaxID=3120278 RepID=A0AAU7CLH7_9BACT